MLFIFIALVLIPLVWIVVYPLIICYIYKIKYGNKVHILYFPLLGQFKYRIDGVRFHKDVIYHKRKIAYEHPQVELIVTHIFSRPYLIFINPEKAKQMLFNYNEYKKRQDEIFRDIIACQGLVYAEGQIWKNQRKELADFFTFEQLSTRIPVIKSLIKEVLQFQDNTRVHIIQKCAIIASRTMQICFFNQTEDAQFNGRNLSEEFQDLSKQFIFITYGSIIHQVRSFFGIKSNSTMKRWLMTSAEKHFLERVQKCRDYINNLIDNHKPGKNKDVFTLLLKNPLTAEVREQIIHQYITFVFAGTDTTSHVAGMAIYMLGVHQEIQDQLREELKNVSFDDVDQVTLNKLSLLNAFLNECLRLQTPSDGLIPRLSIRDHYVGEFFIKKDWYVDVGLQPMMTHPNYFKDNLKFSLQKWQNQSEPEAFIPFSVGPRNCLGQHLAKLEAKLMLIYILKMYRVILDEETDLIMEQAFLYSPQDDRLVKFIKL